MQDAGYAALQIIPSFQGFQGNLERGSSGALVAAGRTGGHKFGEAAGKSAGTHFGSVFKSTVAALGVFELGRLGVDFIKDSIGKASDLNETINKSSVIFGRHERQMDRWAKHAALSLGLSRKGALDSASSFGDMFRQIGFTGDASAKMSRNVVQMAADFGSFSNLGTDDVLERIAGGFRGEYDALQKLIPNISAARVQTEALKESHKKNASELTAQDKAMATLNILHHDGARAMGDFARTSQGNANQQKILSAQYDDQTAKLGKSLLPLQLRWMRFLNTEAIPTLGRFSDWFAKEGAPKLNHFADELGPLAHSLVPALTTTLTDVRDITKDALPYAKGIVDAFNNMPDWAQKGLTVGGLAAFAGKKTGLFELLTGGNGSKGGLLGAFTKATPMPVYVVNEGFGGPGGPTRPGDLAKKAPWLAAAGASVAIAAANGLGQGYTLGYVNKHMGQNAALDASSAALSGRGGVGAGFIRQGIANDTSSAAALTGALHMDYTKSVRLGAKDAAELDVRLQALAYRQGMAAAVQAYMKVADKTGFERGQKGLNEALPNFTAQMNAWSGAAKESYRRTGLLTDQVLIFGDALHGVEGNHKATVTVSTASAQANVDALIRKMSDLTRMDAVTAAAAPAAPSKSDGGHRTPRHVKVSIGGRDFDGYMDDRIDSDNDLKAETQRAGRP